MQRYVDFSIQQGNLVITLTAEGSAALDGSETFEDVIEWQLCNGWSLVPPEAIGALTDAPILSDDVVTDEHGAITDAHSAWGYMDYQIHDPLQQLLAHGSITFQTGYPVDDQYICVEFDRAYTGGDYTGVGERLWLGATFIDRCGSIEAAFTQATGLGKEHIVHYGNEAFSFDEVWKQGGEIYRH